MLPNEPIVVACRQCFADAQLALAGSAQALGSFTVSWYGTDVSDDRGSFALVSPSGNLAAAVGNVLQVVYEGNSVLVYVVGTYTNLTTDLGLARRPFLAVSRLSNDPVFAAVEIVA